MEDNYDPNNGQTLYIPKICRYESSRSTERKLHKHESVFDALHQEARILNDKREILKKQYEKKVADEKYKQIKASEKSNLILFNVWSKKLRELFEQLDNDYDGYISSHKIDISGLSNELLDVLTPLLLKIEEHELVLNFKEFVEITLEFSKCLTLPEKTLLLGAERELFKSPPEEHPFAPSLTENTRAIVELGEFDKRQFQLWEDHRRRSVPKEDDKEMYE